MKCEYCGLFPCGKQGKTCSNFCPQEQASNAKKTKSNEKKYTLNQLRGAFGAGVYSNQGDPYSDNPPVKFVDECNFCGGIKTIHELQDIHYINLEGKKHHHDNIYVCSKCGNEYFLYNEKTNELENTICVEHLRKEGEKHFLNTIINFINQKITINDLIQRDGKRGKNFTLFIQKQYPEIYHMWEIGI